MASGMYTGLHARYEEELTRNPYSVKTWWNYIHFNTDQPAALRFSIYERALTQLPRSYKLWHAYLTERTQHARGCSAKSKKVDLLINCFERALITLHAMPRIWLDYCKMMISMQRFSLIRKTFDRALKTLPITQHAKIWKEYLAWVKTIPVHAVVVHVYKRYLMFQPNDYENFLVYLEENELYSELLLELYNIIQQHQMQDAAAGVIENQSPNIIPNQAKVSKPGPAKQTSFPFLPKHIATTFFLTVNNQVYHTLHQVYMKLIMLGTKNPEVVPDSVPLDLTIRHAMTKFADEIGTLWNALADYYIRQGEFDDARKIYEEAVRTVFTVKDFTMVFDNYIKVEESLVTAKIRLVQEDDDEEDDEEAEEAHAGEDKKSSKSPEEVQEEAEEKELALQEINDRLAYIERLIEMRPFYINAVLLRQNPHNVHEWHNKIKLIKQASPEDESKILAVYHDVFVTVLPQYCKGKYSSLWVSYIQYIESITNRPIKQQENTATTAEYLPDVLFIRQLYQIACSIEYRNIDELVFLYCHWCEWELSLGHAEEALIILQNVTLEPTYTTQGKIVYKGLPSSLFRIIHRASIAPATSLDEVTAKANEDPSEEEKGQELLVKKIKKGVGSYAEGNHGITSFPALHPDAPTIDKIASGGVMLEGKTIHAEIFKQLNIWKFYLDLEECLGTFKTTCLAYEKAIHHKLITPQMILHYAAYCEELHYYEKAFQIYEQGIHSFSFPAVKPLYLTYITKFKTRYGSAKIDRIRNTLEEMFATKLPKQADTLDVIELTMEYISLEEEYGLISNIPILLERSIPYLHPSQYYRYYQYYVKKIESLYGVTRCRQIYESAIQLSILPDEDMKCLCLDYAALEIKLSEIDRARSIYVYASQFVDPRREEMMFGGKAHLSAEEMKKTFWRVWKSFEEQYGNEDTFRDMVRIKRSVETTFSQVNYLAADMAQYFVQGSTAATGTTQPPTGGLSNPVALLEQQAVNAAMEEEAATMGLGLGAAKRKLEEADEDSVASMKKLRA